VILADANVLSDPELGSALANHDRSRTDELAIGTLDAKSLRFAIATVPRATNALLVSHDFLPRSSGG
jgi:hypothetical protein